MNPTKTILVCEDEESIRSFVVINLERAGYTVVQAGSGEEALACFAADPAIDIALLDVMLPGINGFETCRRLRQQSDSMGIIMLTARTQEAEKVNGLQMGADDYVTKPFGTAELIARVDALYRRLETARKQPSVSYLEEIRSGDFSLNLRTRTEILHAVWGEEYVGDEKIVDVNIRRLRMKIEQEPSSPQHLTTVWGMGYRWNA